MCPERMTLPRGIVALRPVPQASEQAPASAEPRSIPLPPLELKEIQRRAYDRGRAVEQKAVADRLGATLSGIEAAVRALDEMREKERADVARFGVEVALAVAEQLVGSSVRSGSHDVRKLVESLLEECLPGLGSGPLQVAVNPADLEALGDLTARSDARAGGGSRIVLAADPELPRAGCRIRAGGAEILADPKVRLAAIAEKLRTIAAAERPDA